MRVINTGKNRPPLWQCGDGSWTYTIMGEGGKPNRLAGSWATVEEATCALNISHPITNTTVDAMIAVRVSRGLHIALSALAKERGVTLSVLVRRMAEEALDAASVGGEDATTATTMVGDAHLQTDIIEEFI